jgi:hypothetical protein
MKRKNYIVTVKLICKTTMEHSQISMKKAEEDVRTLINNYIDNGMELNQIFDRKPDFKYKVERKYE